MRREATKDSDAPLMEAMRQLQDETPKTERATVLKESGNQAYLIGRKRWRRRRRKRREEEEERVKEREGTDGRMPSYITLKRWKWSVGIRVSIRPFWRIVRKCIWRGVDNDGDNFLVNTNYKADNRRVISINANDSPTERGYNQMMYDLSGKETGFLGIEINGNVEMSGTLKIFPCSSNHPRC